MINKLKLLREKAKHEGWSKQKLKSIKGQLLAEKEPLKVLELFGGVGACTQALERLGVNFKIADYVEIDKHAVASYNAINGTSFEPQDVTKWDKCLKVDLIMHGSPCQDFSIIGIQKGGDKGTGTRSSLMYETIRIVEKLRPKYVIWENVKNVLSPKHEHNFKAYIKRLEELGYKSSYKVLNSKDYNIAQNRERVFVVSIRGNNETYTFPSPVPTTRSIYDFLENCTPNGCTLTEHNVEMIANTKYKKETHKANTESLLAGTYKGFAIMDYRYDEGLRIRKNELSPTLTTKGRNSTSGTPIVKRVGEPLRFLSAKEGWRLMGFSDKAYEKAASVTTEGQLYKQAGNSIVVDVLVAVLRELLRGTKYAKGI